MVAMLVVCFVVYKKVNEPPKTQHHIIYEIEADQEQSQAAPTKAADPEVAASDSVTVEIVSPDRLRQLIEEEEPIDPYSSTPPTQSDLSLCGLEAEGAGKGAGLIVSLCGSVDDTVEAPSNRPVEVGPFSVRACCGQSTEEYSTEEY